ncbi:hypothetical protein HPB47_009824 [Ixodes persulcatus]|uniref:Uncharacterized protein n=1 Tax=Ixodes persulcatus TaxID=34615 RepID=A0AC60P0Y6_IXOPE|nr:hypothetical protein HPB47_009824 [Ixodes persulcatus]
MRGSSLTSLLLASVHQLDGDTPLPGKFDLVRVDLEPTEQYRSMVLAGQRPETIVDVCSRALGFWSYQVAQQLGQQEASLERSRRKIAQLEAALTRQAHDCNFPDESPESAGVLRERWELFRRVADLGEQLMDRQRLQVQRAVDPGLQPAVPRPEVYRQHLDPRVPGELDLLFAQTQGDFGESPSGLARTSSEHVERKLALQNPGSWVQSPPLPVSIWMSIVPACGRVSLLRGAR